MALGYFKLAIIAAGIEFRRRMAAERRRRPTTGPARPSPSLISRGLEELR